MAVPYTFGSATTSIPLSQLDSNFATTITLGNTAIQLGNTVTTLNNMTLANATVSATNVTATNITSPLSTALTLQSNAGNTAVTIESSGRVAIATGGAGQGESALEIKSLTGDAPQLQLTQSNVTDGWKIASQASDGALAFYRKQSGTTNGPYFSMSLNGDLQLGYQISAKTVAVPQGLSLVSPSSTALQIYMLKNAQVESHIGFKSSTDTNFYVGTSGGQGAAGIGVYGVYQVNTASSWTAVSDERFKTELQPIENALDKISNVRAVTGRYSYDEENGVTKRRPFLIAQDWLTALPEAVDQQNSEKLGLSYSDTVPLLVAAIKELKAINDTQAETINALTARIVALESK